MKPNTESLKELRTQTYLLEAVTLSSSLLAFPLSSAALAMIGLLFAVFTWGNIYSMVKQGQLELAW